jgi:formimidoylglutamase
MPFARPPAADDPDWPRASRWLSDDVERAGLRVIGVPCSIGSISPSKAFRTPDAVREALQRLSTWDAVGQQDLRDLPAQDLGDWPVANLDLPEAIAAIRAGASGMRGVTSPTVFLGGDNAITRPLVAGLLGDDLTTVGVLTFDAHHDVRSLGDGPRNGTPIRGLIEQEGLPGRNVAQVGIASFANAPAHAAWVADAGIHVEPIDAVHRDGVEAVVDRALDRLAHCDRLFVDVDIDVLDVAYAPACPGARPGGMTPRQLLTAARMCGRHDRVAAADLVEVDAAMDPTGATTLVVAEVLLHFAAGVLQRRGDAG